MTKNINNFLKSKKTARLACSHGSRRSPDKDPHDIPSNVLTCTVYGFVRLIITRFLENGGQSSVDSCSWLCQLSARKTCWIFIRKHLTGCLSNSPRVSVWMKVMTRSLKLWWRFGREHSNPIPSLFCKNTKHSLTPVSKSHTWITLINLPQDKGLNPVKCLLLINKGCFCLAPQDSHEVPSIEVICDKIKWGQTLLVRWIRQQHSESIFINKST